MKTLDVLAAILLVLGGFNWFLVGAFDLDLVKSIFQHHALINRSIYLIIGLASFYQMFQWKAIQMRWKGK